MYQTTHRALRATVAAAGMAALGMSFVGTAAAAPSAQDATPEANSLLGSANQTPNLSNGTPTPGVYNDLFTFEVPGVQTASYHTSSPSSPVLVSDVHHGDNGDEGDSYDPNNDDEDNVCHGSGGSFYDPLNHNAYQHPCQSHGNSFYDGIGLPVTNPVAAKGMNYSLLHDSSTDADTSDEESDQPTSSSSSLAGLTPTAGLTQMNTHHLTQV